MGAGVWGGGLLETSRFKPIPWTGDRIPYREPYYSQVPGYIFICAWDSHPCLKKKPHIWPKDKVEKIYCWTNIHDGCSECLKWWTKWKKKNACGKLSAGYIWGSESRASPSPPLISHNPDVFPCLFITIPHIHTQKMQWTSDFSF